MAARGLLDAQCAVPGSAAVVHVGLPGSHVVGEVGAHQFLCAAIDSQVSGSHFQVHGDPLGGVQIDGARVVLRRTGSLDHTAAETSEEYTSELPPHSFISSAVF